MAAIPAARAAGLEGPVLNFNGDQAMPTSLLQRHHGMLALVRAACSGAPLICFLSIAHGLEDQAILGWLYAYVVAGMLAGGLILVASLRGHFLDHFTLGSDLYLLSGGVAVVSSSTWLLQSFDAMRESGIFLFALGVALTRAACTAWLERKTASRVSLAGRMGTDCGVPALAFVVSHLARGHWMVSTLVPLILLLVQDRLRVRVEGQD